MNKNKNRGVHYLLGAGLSFSLVLGMGATYVHAEAEEIVVDTKGNQVKKNDSKFASVEKKGKVITIGKDNNRDSVELRPEDLFRAYGSRSETKNGYKYDVSEIQVAEHIKHIKLPKDSSNLFSDLKCGFVGFEKFDASQVENMNFMFLNTEVIGTLPNISNWNVENVESMVATFAMTDNMNVEISDWNTSEKLTSLRAAFNYAYGLEVDITNWNVNGVENNDLICDHGQVKGLSEKEFPNLKETEKPVEKPIEEESSHTDIKLDEIVLTPSIETILKKEEVKEEVKEETVEKEIVSEEVFETPVEMSEGEAVNTDVESYQVEGYSTMSVEWVDQDENRALTNQDKFHEGGNYQLKMQLKPNGVVTEESIAKLKEDILASDDRIEKVIVEGKQFARPRNQKIDYLEVTIIYKTVKSQQVPVSRIPNTSDASKLGFYASLLLGSLMVAGIISKRYLKNA